jgi:hypothetical protein
MDLHAWITQQVEQVERSVEDDVLPSGEAEAVLRRCEADRRILARHRLDPDTYEPACKGCGTYGDCDMPNVDNLNDCPELLDLGHAHGLTPDILAGLDRPQAPERKPPRELYDNGGFLAPPITTSDVPAALRGPHWKP